MASSSSSFPIGLIIQSLAGIVALLCMIVVIVRLFQAKHVVLGIISLIFCGIGGFICGWIKAKDLGLQKVMLAWTAAAVVSVVGAFLPGGTVEKMRLMESERRELQDRTKVPLPEPERPSTPAPRR